MVVQGVVELVRLAVYVVGMLVVVADDVVAIELLVDFEWVVEAAVEVARPVKEAVVEVIGVIIEVIGVDAGNVGVLVEVIGVYAGNVGDVVEVLWVIVGDVGDVVDELGVVVEVVVDSRSTEENRPMQWTVSACVNRSKALE